MHSSFSIVQLTLLKCLWIPQYQYQSIQEFLASIFTSDKCHCLKGRILNQYLYIKNTCQKKFLKMYHPAFIFAEKFYQNLNKFHMKLPQANATINLFLIHFRKNFVDCETGLYLSHNITFWCCQYRVLNFMHEQ